MATQYEATLVWPLVAAHGREQDTPTHAYRVQTDMQTTLAKIHAAATGVLQFFAIRCVTYTAHERGHGSSGISGGELRATLTVAMQKESPDYKGPRDARGARHMVNMLLVYFNDNAESGRKGLRTTAHEVGLGLGKAMLEASPEPLDTRLGEASPEPLDNGEDSDASAEQTPAYESAETVEYTQTEDFESNAVDCPQHLEYDSLECMHSMHCMHCMDSTKSEPASKRRRTAAKTDDEDDEWTYV